MIHITSVLKRIKTLKWFKSATMINPIIIPKNILEICSNKETNDV